MNEKKLLLVVDMQNDFIDGSLGTPEAEAIVPKVCEKIRNWDGRIWLTQDTHNENYLETNEGKHLPVKHCINGTEGWEVHDDVMDSVVCSKAYEYDKRKCLYYPDGMVKWFDKEAFGSWRLVADRSDYWDGIESVELIGLCTDICVISNAVLIKSFFPEIEISVDASCCAGVTPQSHKNALEAMKMLQIEIKNEEV